MLTLDAVINWTASSTPAPKYETQTVNIMVLVIHTQLLQIDKRAHECMNVYIYSFSLSDNFCGETWKKAAFIVQISRYWGQKMFQSSFHACFLFSLQIMIHKSHIHKQPLINVSLHVGIFLFCCSKSMNWKKKQCPATIILHPKAFFYCGKKAKLITRWQRASSSHQPSGNRSHHGA